MLSYTKDSLKTHIQALAEPTSFLDWVDYNIPMEELGLNEQTKNNFWKESLLWAWSFKCLGTLFEISLLYLLINYLVSSELDFSSFDFFVSETNYKTGFAITYLFLGFSTLYFPINVVSQNLITLMSVKTTLGLIDGRQSSQLNLWDSIGLSNTSYIYQVIPFLGSFVQRITQFVLLYTMLRWKFKWGRAKSVLVLVAPTLIFSTLVFLMFLSAIIF